MQSHHALQDTFLTALKNQQVSVSIFLISGIKLHGVVGDFDEHVIMLKHSITQMVYKHAISTIVPSADVNLKP